jgi:uncharacterized membrane protein
VNIIISQTSYEYKSIPKKIIKILSKDFFENFFSIMIFAVFGTLFNVFTIGYSLYGLAYAGILGDFFTSELAADGVNTTLVFHQLAPTEERGDKTRPRCKKEIYQQKIPKK